MCAVIMQRQHPEVRCGVAGKLAVEPHFFRAKMPALLQRGEIKKTKVYGLLNFIDVFAREVDARGVGFAVFNAAPLTGVVGNIKQKIVQFHDGEKIVC